MAGNLPWRGILLATVAGFVIASNLDWVPLMRAATANSLCIGFRTLVSGSFMRRQLTSGAAAATSS